MTKKEKEGALCKKELNTQRQGRLPDLNYKICDKKKFIIKYPFQELKIALNIFTKNVLVEHKVHFKL